MKNDSAKWKNHFLRDKKIILCTASRTGKPNGIIVISMGFIDGSLLIADCQMNKTLKNLKENSSACLIGGYYKLIGKAKIFNQGKYFEIAKQKSKGYKVKNAITIKISYLIDLDKNKILNFEL